MKDHGSFETLKKFTNIIIKIKHTFSIIKGFLPIKTYLYACILCIFASNLTHADAFNLPEIGDSSGNVISPDFERRIGRAFLREVRKNGKIINDPEVESYIQSIGSQLVANSENATTPFTFFVIDAPEINAFAAPGGVIGVNSGTILSSKNESELAAVLAHEIAHVTQRHIARTFEKNTQSALPTAAALLGAILIGIINPEAGAAALTVAQGARLQTQISFTRENEKEADSVGMQLLARSGYDPHGMPAFFERLQEGTEYNSNTSPEFLRTHPLTLSRIAESKARTLEYPRGTYKNLMSYELVVAKLEVNSHQNYTDALNIFSHRISLTAAKKDSSDRYGYALALIKAGKYDQARKQLETLLSWDQENTAYLIAMGNLEIAQNNFTDAQKIFQYAYQLYPNYKPIIFAYAKFLLNTQQPELALKILRHYRPQKNISPSYYNLLAQAEADSGFMIASTLARADFLYLTGDTQAAIKQLESAKEGNDVTERQKNNLSAKIEQLQYELAIEETLKI